MRDEHKRALHMIAGCYGNGCSAPLLAKHGFSLATIKYLAERKYVRLAPTYVGAMHSTRAFELIVWVYITDHGRNSIKETKLWNTPS